MTIGSVKHVFNAIMTYHKMATQAQVQAQAQAAAAAGGQAPPLVPVPAGIPQGMTEEEVRLAAR